MLSSKSWKNRDREAAHFIGELFSANGWDVEEAGSSAGKPSEMLIRRGKDRYLVEIKSLLEGRADRVLPLLSQAVLVAQSNACEHGNARPLAIVCVDHASLSLIDQVSSFADRYIPNQPIGLVSKNGLRFFRGMGFAELNAEPEEPRWLGSSPSNQPVNLFSDLNQWMLKVLLAPELPEHLLNAPREKYRNSGELALAANVSPMSAYRFLQQLRNEGHLDESSRHIMLVRRAELFRRWRSAAIRPAPELPMRFLIRAPAQQQIQSLLKSQDGAAYLGLFAAADALKLGHVSGVPPYVCVPKLPRPGDEKWKLLVIAAPSEAPDLILRQSPAPKSAARGAVRCNDLIVSDVIQVWLDVANHPSRGEEQADLIYQNVFRPMIEEGY